MVKVQDFLKSLKSLWASELCQSSLFLGTEVEPVLKITDAEYNRDGNNWMNESTDRLLSMSVQVTFKSLREKLLKMIAKHKTLSRGYEFQNFEGQPQDKLVQIKIPENIIVHIQI